MTATRALALSAVAATLLAQRPPEDPQARSALSRGVQLYRQGDYDAAIRNFQRAGELAPNSALPFVYLGYASLAQYVPGDQSPDNLKRLATAEAAFQHTLVIDPENKGAVTSLGSLHLQEANATDDPSKKAQQLDEAQKWYRDLAELDPSDKSAPFQLGVISWTRANAAVQSAQAKAGLKAGEVTSLPKPVRSALRAQVGKEVDAGIESLTKTLDLDPQYEAAMNYLERSYRLRASLADTEDAAAEDRAQADEWRRKQEDMRKSRGLPQ